ncbi:MAG: hypothetical protein HQK50_03140 [Oligoflexia bacterium]|nr:hypothetical protein [Oligoflexia bacterium]
MNDYSAKGISDSVKEVKYIGITTKFVLLILLFSMIGTVCSTAFHLYTEYRRGTEHLQDQLNQIEQGHLSSIAATVWDVDREKLSIHLQGIVKLPNIEKVSYTNPKDSRDDLVIGAVSSAHISQRVFPVRYYDNNKNEWKQLGDLTIVAGLDKLQTNLILMGKRILIVQAMQIFLIGLFMFLIFQKLITRHLKQITNYTKNLDNVECLKNKLKLDRSDSIVDEFTVIVNATNAMTDRLYHYTTNLHGIIDEKTKNIKYILNHIKQGIFTILPNNKIHPEYSIFLEKILETKNIAGQDVMDVMFKNTNVTPEVLSQLLSALTATLGEESINFEIHSDAFVKEVRKENKDGGTKILELDWSPICNNKNQIEKIMVTVRNVTELRKLQNDAINREKTIEVFSEILALSPEKFLNFAKEARQILDSGRSGIKGIPQIKGITYDVILEEGIAYFLRSLRELKSLVREHNLFSLLARLADNEREVDFLRKNSLLQRQRSQHKDRVGAAAVNLVQSRISSAEFDRFIISLLKLHKNLTTIFEEYISMGLRRIFKNNGSGNAIKKGGEAVSDGVKSPVEVEIKSETINTTEYFTDQGGNDFVNQVHVDKGEVDLQIQLLKDFTVDNLTPAQRGILSKTYQFFSLIGSDSLKNVASPNFSALAALSRQLDKAPPKIVMRDPGIHIKNVIHNPLQNVTQHLLRNSIDHGIEPANERRSKGKEVFGTIEFDLFLNKYRFIIRYRDDGRGLNVDLIKKLAIEQGLLPSDRNVSMEEICNAIFAPGFSTAKEISDISGRGIGLEACKKIIEDLNGDISVVLAHAPIKEIGMYPFEVIISLPRQYVVLRSG